MINITMTAVRRRAILERTLESFYANLLYGLDTRIIINVDPLGDDESSELTVDLCKEYSKRVIARTPDVADFGQAFYWTWQTAARLDDSPWILNLEDDWEMMQAVCIKKIFSILKKFRYLALLRFSLWPSGPKYIMAWNRVPFAWNGCFFKCPERSMNWAYCGHPSIIKRKWFNTVFELIDPTLNPEKQFRRQNQRLVTEVAKWEYGLYQKPNSPGCMRDIGRPWRDAAGYIKVQDKCEVGKWIKAK
jgi:hypothetical protein